MKWGQSEGGGTSTSPASHLTETDYCRTFKQNRNRHMREWKRRSYCWQWKFCRVWEFAEWSIPPILLHYGSQSLTLLQWFTEILIKTVAKLTIQMKINFCHLWIWLLVTLVLQWHWDKFFQHDHRQLLFIWSFPKLRNWGKELLSFSKATVKLEVISLSYRPWIFHAHIMSLETLSVGSLYQ